jgi:hypothetical protein
MTMRPLRTWALAVLCGFAAIFPAGLWACPSCKAANETDARLPMAYQASILFMLGVPGTIGLLFGAALYRLNRAQVKAMQEFESGEVWYGPPESH